MMTEKKPHVSRSSASGEVRDGSVFLRRRGLLMIIK